MKPKGLTGTFPPIILAVAAQAAAFASMLVIIQLAWRLVEYDIPVLLKLVGISLLAATYSSFLRLPSWWLYIQLALPPLVAAALVLQLPSWAYLVPLALCILIFWNSADDRVPLYLTNKVTARGLLAEIPTASSGRFYDLGCGPAGTLLHLARARPNWTFVGVETSPLIWLIARIRVALSGCDNIEILRQNLWSTDLQNADIVYVFLSPAPMDRLFRKAQTEMRTGSQLISNSFEVPEQSPSEIKQLEDGRKTKLLIWNFQ